MKTSSKLQFAALAGLIALSPASSFAMGKKAARTMDFSQSSHVISDSLVKDLACATLKPETVLNSLQPDAFSSQRHLPTRNWSSGVLGQCWSLSHFQRQVFYLGRFDKNTARSLADKTDEPARAALLEGLLDMIRGSQPLTDYKKRFENKTFEETAPLFVFNVGEPSINSYYSLFTNTLVGGLVDENRKKRNFQSEIEHYQEARFGNPGNASMISGGRNRDRETNVQTFAEIRDNLARNRLPLVVVRPSLTAQHVVVIKSMRQQGDVYTFTVYDSNFPSSENSMTYVESEGNFYAPSIVRPFGVEAYAPVGIFHVDNGDMDKIQDALYNHYVGRCQELEKASSAL